MRKRIATHTYKPVYKSDFESYQLLAEMWMMTDGLCSDWITLFLEQSVNKNKRRRIKELKRELYKNGDLNMTLFILQPCC
jgi:hypothetical protein